MSNPDQVGGGVRSPHDVIMGIVRRPVSMHDIRTESYLGGHTFERLQMGDFVLQLLLETSEFLPRAASYRNFPVAAGAWCIGEGRKYGRVLGYNVKIDNTDLVNIHAEDQIVTKTDDAAFSAISVFAVIGELQEDHASGKYMDTLMPCGRCRSRLSRSQLIREQTLFVMARPDFTVIQLGSLAAIKAAHDQGDFEGIVTFKFSETPEILRPRNIPDAWSRDWHPISMPEIDSSDYDKTVGLYLTRRYFESQQSE